MDASKPLTVRVGPRSDIGKTRTEQQDRMTRFRSPFGDVFVVADGMGGHEGGATAAQMVVTRLQDHLEALAPSTALAEALQTAVRSCNAEVYARAHSGDPKVMGMGATIVLAVVEGCRFVVAHAGDSRAYLLRAGRLRRLTKDHTRTQRMVDAGVLSEDEARHHPDASVVTRALGADREVELSVAAPALIEDGDVLMLCSDGLSGYVEDAQIERALIADTDPLKVADALVGLGLAAGGEDNITVQVIQFGARSLQATARRRALPGALGRWILLALVIAAGALALFMALRRQPAAKRDVPRDGGARHAPTPARSREAGTVRPSPERVTPSPAPTASEVQRRPKVAPAKKGHEKPRHE